MIEDHGVNSHANSKTRKRKSKRTNGANGTSGRRMARPRKQLWSSLLFALCLFAGVALLTQYCHEENGYCEDIFPPAVQRVIMNVGETYKVNSQQLVQKLRSTTLYYEAAQWWDRSKDTTRRITNDIFGTDAMGNLMSDLSNVRTTVGDYIVNTVQPQSLYRWLSRADDTFHTAQRVIQSSITEATDELALWIEKLHSLVQNYVNEPVRRRNLQAIKTPPDQLIMRVTRDWVKKHEAKRNKLKEPEADKIARTIVERHDSVKKERILRALNNNSPNSDSNEPNSKTTS